MSSERAKHPIIVDCVGDKMDYTSAIAQGRKIINIRKMIAKSYVIFYSNKTYYICSVQYRDGLPIQALNENNGFSGKPLKVLSVTM
jgi:hypothetical protein